MRVLRRRPEKSAVRSPLNVFIVILPVPPINLPSIFTASAIILLPPEIVNNLLSAIALPDKVTVLLPFKSESSVWEVTSEC